MQPFESSPPLPTIAITDEDFTTDPTGEQASPDYDPSLVMLTCASCGAQMIERKCKLICPCGYFLSCSDYY